MGLLAKPQRVQLGLEGVPIPQGQQIHPAPCLQYDDERPAPFLPRWQENVRPDDAVPRARSSFAYKGRDFDVKQVARELGVRYVLEGRVRKADQRVRITAQFIETSSGAHLWANQFDGEAI